MSSEVDRTAFADDPDATGRRQLKQGPLLLLHIDSSPPLERGSPLRREPRTANQTTNAAIATDPGIWTPVARIIAIRQFHKRPPPHDRYKPGESTVDTATTPRQTRYHGWTTGASGDGRRQPSSPAPYMRSRCGPPTETATTTGNNTTGHHAVRSHFRCRCRPTVAPR